MEYKEITKEYLNSQERNKDSISEYAKLLTGIVYKIEKLLPDCIYIRIDKKDMMRIGFERYEGMLKIEVKDNEEIELLKNTLTEHRVKKNEIKRLELEEKRDLLLNWLT